MLHTDLLLAFKIEPLSSMFSTDGTNFCVRSSPLRGGVTESERERERERETETETETETERQTETES